MIIMENLITLVPGCDPQDGLGFFFLLSISSFALLRELRYNEIRDYRNRRNEAFLLRFF